MKIKNENRPGYKKTKVGWIPEGWEETSLGKICELQSGKFITASAISEERQRGSFPCFGGNGLRGYVDSYSHDGDYPLIGRQGALCGNVCWASEKFYATEHAVVATPTDNTASKWLYYKLDHLNLNKYATGVAQPGLSVQVLNQVITPAPPLPEQEAIAEVLECWDKGIRTLENKISKKRLIKKGLMQKLLSGQIRLSGFFKPWKNVRLNEVLTEHKENGSGKEEVHSVSVHKGVINQVEHLGRSFSAKDTSNYNLVKPGDIIYTKSPTGDFPLGIIKQSMLTKTAIVSPLYGVFTPMTKHLGLMLHCFFDSPVNTGNYLRPIIQKGAKNTINITNTTFLSGKMMLPLDKEEQRAIAEVLAAADGEIEALEKKLALWKDQKKFLLNNLVTGTIRLPEFKN